MSEWMKRHMEHAHKQPMQELETVEVTLTETRTIKKRFQVAIPKRLQGKSLDFIKLFTDDQLTVGTIDQGGLDVERVEIVNPTAKDDPEKPFCYSLKNDLLRYDRLHTDFKQTLVLKAIPKDPEKS